MTEPAPAKKAAAKKTATRRKAPAAPRPATDSAKVDVVMVRPSRGAKAGDKRTVDAKRAAGLVRAGLAKYAS